jgi:hypothetical protein
VQYSPAGERREPGMHKWAPPLYPQTSMSEILQKTLFRLGVFLFGVKK